MPNDIAPIDPIRQALATAKDIPDLKGVRDMATAARAWAKARSMGVEAENDASEYILRAERRIGQALIRMAETGERSSGRLLGGTAHGKPIYRDEQAVTLDDLGISNQDSTRWRAVAAIPDDTFEHMLREARLLRERIAKVNFYRTPNKPREVVIETAEDPGFGTLRAGAYYLLGWRVDDHGVGGPTKNGLLDLPEDELRQLAHLIQHLVTAYQEARQKGVKGARS